MKYEWRKKEKNLYLPPAYPCIIQVPPLRFLTVKGKGNPNNNSLFAAQTQALYALSYAIKMAPKNGFIPQNYFDYTVFPLEGIWDFDINKKPTDLKINDKIDKDNLIYTLMIRQPDFVTPEVCEFAFEKAAKKVSTDILKSIVFEEISDGISLQMMHIGSFDDEHMSFELMTQFMTDNNLEKRMGAHREIYLSDPRKTEASKLKTVLRYFLK